MSASGQFFMSANTKLTSSRANATSTANHGHQATTIRLRQRMKRANNSRHNNTLLRESVATTL